MTIATMSRRYQRSQARMLRARLLKNEAERKKMKKMKEKNSDADVEAKVAKGPPYMVTMSRRHQRSEARMLRARLLKSEAERREMKKMKQKNSDADVEVKVAKEPPYKVLFPGQRRISAATNGRYALRDFKDPRITKFPPFEKSRLGRLYRALINRKFEDETEDEDEDEDETDESEDVSIDELRKSLDKNEVQTGKLDDESNGESRMFVDETEDKDDNEDESEGESTEDDIPAAATVVTMVFSDSDEELLDVKEDKDEIRKRSLEHAERLKKDYYRRVKELPQQLKDEDCQCAEAAIKFYNEKHGTDYEIVETLGSYDTLYIGIWYHCNFKAQRKSVSGSGRRSSPKLFFAELYRTQYVLNVNLCKMLDGRGQRPHLVRGCEICCNQMWHPVEGFKVGKYIDSDSN